MVHEMTVGVRHVDTDQMQVVHHALGGNEPLATGHTVHAFAGPNGRRRRPPAGLLKTLERFAQTREDMAQ